MLFLKDVGNMLQINKFLFINSEIHLSDTASFFQQSTKIIRLVCGTIQGIINAIAHRFLRHMNLIAIVEQLV